MSRTPAAGLVAVAVAASLLVGLALHLGHLGHLPQRPRSAAEPVSGPAGAPASSTATAMRRRTSPALGVLRKWDARRAAAYAAGSTERLARLYAPGSRAGAADVRLLAAYRSRGLRVTGMGTQLLAVEVVQRGPGRWVLRVEDRLAHAAAVGHGHRWLLPRDGASTRTLTLVHAAGGNWRVLSVVEG